MKMAGLNEVPPHTLRHFFVWVAADLEFSEITTAAMLGQRSGSETSRYIHHLDSVLLAAADKVASEIGSWMGQKSAT
jgi:integrase